MSSTFENGEKEKEVTPEALLERLKNAKWPVHFSDLFENLSHLILRVINKSDADVATKIQATLYMGQLSGRFYVLLDAYEVAEYYDLFEDDLHYAVEDVLKKLIEVYAYLKKGGSLKNAIDMISWASLSAQHRVKEYMYHLAEMIEDLSRPDPWSYHI